MLVVQLPRGVYSSENAPVLRWTLLLFILFRVLSFGLWALVSGLEEKKEAAGGDSQTIVKCHCGRTLKGKEYKDSTLS